jgi:hypothetical protein
MPGPTIAAECSLADFDLPSSSAATMGNPTVPVQIPPIPLYQPWFGRRKDQERNCRSAAAAHGSQGRCCCAGRGHGRRSIRTELAETQRLRVQIHQSGQAVTQTARQKKHRRRPIRRHSGSRRVVPGLEVKDKPNRRRGTLGLPMLVSLSRFTARETMSASMQN